jgi:hypothetical protein
MSGDASIAHHDATAEACSLLIGAIRGYIHDVAGRGL